MINPTTQAGLQFNAPYDLLPNAILTNPTVGAISQFTKPIILGQVNTYNILPDNAYSNTTIAAPAQFATPLVLGQFNTYDILPNTVYTNPTIAAIGQFSQPLSLGQYDTFNYVTTNDIITNTMLPTLQQFTPTIVLGGQPTFNYTSSNDVIPNPTVGVAQFSPMIVLGTEPTFNYTSSNDVIPNPTVGAGQFSPTIVLGTEPTFNYTSSNDFIANPTVGAGQFSPMIILGTEPTFNYTSSNDFILNAFSANNWGAQSGLALLSGSTKNPTLVDNTWGFGAVNPVLVAQAPPQAGLDSQTAVISQFKAPTVLSSYTSTIGVDPAIGINTNITPKSVVANLLGFGASALGSIAGIPQVSQVGQTALGSYDSTNAYLTLAKDRLTRRGIRQYIKYPDFRSTYTFPKGDNFGETNASFTTPDQSIAYFTSRRVDGLAASLRFGMQKSWKSIIYAAAAATPIGPYSVFNLDGFGNTGYGWGDHDNPDAFRNDFTIRSHVATTWEPSALKQITSPVTLTGQANAGPYTTTFLQSGYWRPTRAPQDVIIPFRGDKVSVIDFGQRTLKEAYRWKPKRALELFDKQSLTQDFIKFYLTGPKLHAGMISNDFDDKDPESDDIIVFRAHITNFDDSFTANWSPVNMIGRADPNYTYTGMTRDVSLSFDVYATDRDEVKPIWRKLNALAGYTAPTYDPESIAMIGSWMRLTVGDIFVQQPVTLTSVSYTFGMDAPWEINIEEDPTMMQVPLKIGVSLQFNMITDYLPQKKGRFYSLAKRYDSLATPKRGNDNWLSDFEDNVDVAAKIEAKEDKASNKPKTATIKNKPKTATNRN